MRDDPLTLEEPGKIGHEFRAAPPPSFVAAGWPVAGPFAYYGTADATAGSSCSAQAVGGVRARRPRGRGLARRGRWTRAAGWCATHQAVRARQQGWRDTIDAAGDAGGGGFLRADGTNPAPPLADVDTQAVAVAALRALGLRRPASGRAALVELRAGSRCPGR